MKMHKKTIFSTITTLGMIATTLSCLPAMSASATTTYGDTNDDGSVTMSDVVLANSTFRSAIGIHTNGNRNDHWGTRITTPLLRFYNNNSYIG